MYVIAKERSDCGNLNPSAAKTVYFLRSASKQSQTLRCFVVYKAEDCRSPSGLTMTFCRGFSLTTPFFRSKHDIRYTKYELS